MQTIDEKILEIFVDKTIEFSGTQIGNDLDGFITISIELKDKQVFTIRLIDLCNLAQKSGLSLKELLCKI